MKNKEIDVIPIAFPTIGEEEARAVYDVVKSGWLSMGIKVQQFESMICSYTGAKHAIAMNSGTSTLHALLIALGVKPGDEVILPSLTYISSVNAVLYVGATPILCDSDKKTFNTTTDHVKERITNRTKVFMTVDLKGLPVDFNRFKSLSDETGITHISDSAESFGARYLGKKVGTQATAHSFSFFANKNITTGEGGVVVTDDTNLAKILRIVRNQGQEGRYNHTWLGHNYRMTDISAAIGIEQLKRIDNILEEKAYLAKRFTSAFSNTEEIVPPYVPHYVDRPSWYMYSITVDKKTRDPLAAYLHSKNIETRLSFPPIHIQPYFRNLFRTKPSDYPGAIQSFLQFLDIPIWNGMDATTQNLLISEIINFAQQPNSN